MSASDRICMRSRKGASLARVGPYPANPLSISFWAARRACAVVAIAAVAAGMFPPLSMAAATDVVLEDFKDIVTGNDRGFNDFSGNMGDINGWTESGSPPSFGTGTVYCESATDCALRFSWDFGGQINAFTGQFVSLFGLTSTLWTRNGTTIETISFPEHTLDLDRVDGPVAEPGGARKFLQLCAELRYGWGQPLNLKIELQDVAGGRRFGRFQLQSAASPQTHCWSFRDSSAFVPGTPDLDIHVAKVLAFVIERRHVGDGVDNPVTGMVEIRRIWFVSDRPEVAPESNEELLALLARRTYQYFVDWSSRKTDSLGIPQDRSTFADLLTVGGVGFALPAHIVAAERGWISRADAAKRVLDAVRTLDRPSLFCASAVGCIGYRGFFYHFLGPDGRRKLNFDHPSTPEDERENTVELATVDTALALMGVLAAQSYFNGADSAETEIRTRAQAIYDRVDWPFFLHAARRQFYLGWKPNEHRCTPNVDPNCPPFAVPDGAGTGAYSGEQNTPSTWDFCTDEALLIALLALGSTTHPVSSDVWCAIKRRTLANGVIGTYPGALFTFQFLGAFIDPSMVVSPDCPADWYTNSASAMDAAIAYTTSNPSAYPTYGRYAWGLSAAEGPSDIYHAYGAPPLAIGTAEQDGTISYYSMMSAVGYGMALKQEAIDVLRAAWQRGHWHSRFGLPDAFHDDISAVLAPESAAFVFRNSGPWINRALFAIDQGPMLLHLENARTGLIQQLVASNPNVAHALARVRDAKPADSDGDGIPDATDNCTFVANPDQRDSDGDGYGNACDADLNNDGIVNFADLAIVRQRFFTSDPHSDLNGDGIINFADLAILKQRFFQAPGPNAARR